MIGATLGDTRRMHARYRAGLTLAEVGAEFGLSKSGVQKAFARWNMKRRPPSKVPKSPPKRKREGFVYRAPPGTIQHFCDQCDKLVSDAEAAACRSRFCKVAREPAGQGLGSYPSAGA